MQDTPGLEVETTNGDWIRIDPVPGTFVVSENNILKFFSKVGSLYAYSDYDTYIFRSISETCWQDGPMVFKKEIKKYFQSSIKFCCILC